MKNVEEEQDYGEEAEEEEDEDVEAARIIEMLESSGDEEEGVVI